MRKQTARLIQTDNDRTITPAADPEFWHHLKLGLLLALREQGILNDLQLRMARERLGGAV